MTLVGGGTNEKSNHRDPPYVFVMTGGGPGYATWVTELYIYKQAFQFNKMGASAVVAVILLLVTVLFIVLSLRFRERLGEEYE